MNSSGVECTMNYAEQYRLAIEYRFDRFLQNYFDGDRVKADMVMSAAITVGLYWMVGLLYTVVDVTERPKWILRYKIQPSSQVNKASMFKLVKQVLLNQLYGMTLGFFYLRFKYTYMPPSEHIPSLTRFVYEIVAFMLIREVFFYYAHRGLHHPSVYRFIHKQHHEWQTPIAIAAIYCNPIEHILANSFPVLIGPLLMQSHSFTFYLWEVYFILLTLNDHCGFHFPLSLSPIYHDYHHWKFTGNYGILGIFDWLHGTDKTFRNSKYHKLDRIYFSIFPPKDISEAKFE